MNFEKHDLNIFTKTHKFVRFDRGQYVGTGHEDGWHEGVGHQGGTVLNYFLIILVIVKYMLIDCNFTNKTNRVIEYYKELSIL